MAPADVDVGEALAPAQMPRMRFTIPPSARLRWSTVLTRKAHTKRGPHTNSSGRSSKKTHQTGWKGELRRSEWLASLKRQLHYDSDVPRCETCKHFRKAGSVLIDSLPRAFGPKCTLHDFNVRQCGCCDTWAGHDGSDLAE